MKRLLINLIFALVAGGTASGQTPTAWGYNTGYGAVYGSFGLAQTMQSMYNVARAKSSKTTARVRGGELAVDSNAQAKARSSSPETKPVAVPSRVVRDLGRFQPDATVDTGTTLAEALGETADEKALIKKIYTTTKTAYDKEADTRGWKNNVAGGLTFFTITAVAVYHDIADPGDEVAAASFDVLNSALNETPEFATVANKNKQGFNDMLIGFSGIVLGSYIEAKQNSDAAALANAKALAGMLIKMILKTDAENIRIENGRLVMK